MPRPGEKVILAFNEKMYKRYTIVHLNEGDPLPNGTIFIANYSVGEDRPIDSLGKRYVIGKRYDPKNGKKAVLVVPEGDSIEEELYNLALKEARKYAESKGLNLEDRTDFQPNSP